MYFQILSSSTLREHKRYWELELLCGRQRARIGRLEAKIKRLEEQLRRSSRNPSQPPSMDGPQVARAPAGPRRRWRRSGGRVGHPGQTRALALVDNSDGVVDCWPATSVGCNQPLVGTDPEPLRHQASEIPVPRVTITEYRRLLWATYMDSEP